MRRPLQYLALSCYLAFLGFPLLWLLGTALKGPGELATGGLVPLSPTLENFGDAVQRADLVTAATNSLVVALGTTTLVLVLALPAAYALARYRTRLKIVANGWVLVSQVFPVILVVVPLFLILRQFRLVDSLVGLTLVHAVYALPFALWMLQGYIAAVPRDVEEAGVVDGAGRVRVLTWDNVHDQLVTQFQGGTAPDVIHDESADIAGFARQGYLADLGPHLSRETRASVPQGVWDAVTVDGKTVAAPTLLQSYVVFANTTILEQAGVTIPTSPTWTWEELAAAARRTTTPERSGLGWGLRQPTATVMSLGLNFGGTFFTGSGDAAAVQVGEAELEVPRRIHEMTYVDRSLDPTSLTQSGSDVITAFLDGRYAMVVAGSYVAQQLAESAPPGFAWRVLPALAGSSPNQAANPQTLSVPADSPYVEQAADFIEFYLQSENLVAVAQGEWLIPASEPARAAVEAATGGQNGWEATLDGAHYLTTAPFQGVADYPQWKDQIATPALQRYLGNQSDLATLQRELTDGWAQVAGG